MKQASCALLLVFYASNLALSEVADGIGTSTASEQYGGLMVLPGTALAAGGGIAALLTGPVWGVGEVSYFRIGRGRFIGRTTWTDPTMQASSVVTAMVGLELGQRGQTRLAPFVSGSVGVGRVSIGDMKSNQMSGATFTEHTQPMTVPALAMGVGLRSTPSTSGLSMSFGIRWVSILTEGQPMNIVPLSIGVSF